MFKERKVITGIIAIALSAVTLSQAVPYDLWQAVAEGSEKILPQEENSTEENLDGNEILVTEETGAYCYVIVFNGTYTAKTALRLNT